MNIKKLTKKRQKSLAPRTSQGFPVSATPAAAAAAAASPSASAAAASAAAASAAAASVPQSASVGSLQPATITTDQSIHATSIDQPVTEPTIHVAPVPAHSEASAPTCQPSLTISHISTSPEVNLDSVVATQVKHYVHPTEKYPRLSKFPTRAQVMNITDILLAKNCPYSVIDVVPLDVIPFFETLLQRQYPLDRQLRDDCLLWRTWSTSRFCGELRKAVPDTAVARPNSASSFNEVIAKLPVNFDLEDPAFELALDEQLRAICAAFPDKTKEMELVATKLLISRLPDQPINWQSILFRDIGNRKVGSIETVSDFRFIWLAQLDCSSKASSKAGSSRSKFTGNLAINSLKLDAELGLATAVSGTALRSSPQNLLVVQVRHFRHSSLRCLSKGYCLCNNVSKNGITSTGTTSIIEYGQFFA